MDNLLIIIGRRIRNYRIKLNLSQERLAEIATCHPTYIGQIERGEKNATIESIEKICSALGISLSQLFDKIGPEKDLNSDFASLSYDLISSKSIKEQEKLYTILSEISNYKNL